MGGARQGSRARVHYRELYTAITGESLSAEELILQSERVYNFQRTFNIRQGFGHRKDDYPPYRAMGPVPRDEYEARGERYDKQMKEKMGIEPAGKSLKEKVAITREYRMKQYDSLVDAVFKRRGWTKRRLPDTGAPSEDRHGPAGGAGGG